MKLCPENIWRHYKGGLYWFISLAQLESTGEQMAVYRCTETGKTYVRPIEEFIQKFKNESGNNQIYRGRAKP